jgi:sugar/nucleoside kinase (ribokinase family)
MIDLDRVKDMSILMVGDSIMDEYVYVKPLGKAIKESALSVDVGKREVFKGGVWAAAAHVANFCRNVDVWTGGEVMWNRRLVDETYMRKLFVMHEKKAYPDEIIHHHDVGAYDAVIVTDFGHGFVTRELIARLSKEARFLAVNAQTNASNYGFNMITKYSRADLVVIDEIEARLAAHDRDSPIEDVILALGFKKIIVTMGSNGAVGFDGAFERQRAVAGKILDTMGAGDAFLSVAAPFAAAGLPMRDVVRIGNAAGAVKVGIIGHRTAVEKEQLRAALNG